MARPNPRVTPVITTIRPAICVCCCGDALQNRLLAQPEYTPPRWFVTRQIGVAAYIPPHVAAEPAAGYRRPDFSLPPHPGHGEILLTRGDAISFGNQRRGDGHRGPAPCGFDGEERPVCQYFRVYRSAEIPPPAKYK